MTARELFNQLVTDRRELNKIQTLIKALRDDSGYHSMDYSQERVQTSPNGVTPAEKIVTRILELEKREKELTDRFLTHKDKAVRILLELDWLQEEYVARRYIMGQTTQEIAKELNYSESYLFHVGVEAFREIDRRGLCD